MPSDLLYLFITKLLRSIGYELERSSIQKFLMIIKNYMIQFSISVIDKLRTKVEMATLTLHQKKEACRDHNNKIRLMQIFPAFSHKHFIA